MPIFNLFSKRMKAERGELPDVYQYTNFDRNLKVKIIYIIRDCFGDNIYNREEICKEIIDILCREYGTFQLPGYCRDSYKYLSGYFLEEHNTERALNVVELCFQNFDKKLRKSLSHYKYSNEMHPDEAIKELNDRFKEDGFGYKYESGMIMKLTNEFSHNEIVKPVLGLLSNKSFKGANEEFLSAHLHFRKSQNKECITDCLKAFESTMKIICKLKKYETKDNATAKKLIAILFEKNYIPQYLQSEFSSLQLLLESGVPTVRNKLSAHGQGDKKIESDNNITEYVIHMTACNILFLMKLL